MSREMVADKAVRYLAEGRLVITHVGGGVIHAKCRGEGQIYTLGYGERGWRCSRPARGRCAHLAALQRVTARP